VSDAPVPNREAGEFSSPHASDGRDPLHQQRAAAAETADLTSAFISRLESILDVLTDVGRTMAQGALPWLVARSRNLIPTPSARSIEQAIENASAIEKGPAHRRRN
jgi:aryl-alcohol dehydrogenase-like predicted oxidoreductase